MKKVTKKTDPNRVSKWKLTKPPFIKLTDKRYARQKKQLQERGFSDSETWALDSIICQFILPRLIRFKEVHGGIPIGLTEENWNTILDQMIFAFDWSLNHEGDKYKNLSKKEESQNWIKYNVGIKKFAEYFRDLWW